MIKRLIFDIDNTLLKWEDKYYDYSLGNTFKELGLNFDRSIIKPFDEVVDTYENYYDIYDKDKFLNFLNSKLDFKLPKEFINIWIKYLGDCYEKPSKELIDTLEYLKSKYDLIILSNWFTESQEKRLKNMGIDKYFSRQIYTDILKNKPNKETFLEAIKPYNVDECIMIGDSKEKDIKGAESIGMKAILIDDKTKVEDLRRIL